MEIKSLIGAALIATSVLVGMLVAPQMTPYRLISVGAGSFWFLNARTGEVRLCLVEISPVHHACTKPWRPNEPDPSPAANPFDQFDPKPSH